MLSELVTVGAPDGHAREVDVHGRRYKSRDGLYRMRSDDARMLRKAGGFPASLAGAASRTIGRRCAGCGFGSFFIHCSRCGRSCVREAA